MERQCQNAMELAIFLKEKMLEQQGEEKLLHGASQKVVIQNVHYPGLKSHPQHSQAKKQMMNNMFEGMLSFEVGCPRKKVNHSASSVEEVNDMNGAMAVAGTIQLIKRATSLGGTETLIEHRASIEPEGRVVSAPGLLRVSVGLENINDLKNDLERALKIANLVISRLEDEKK